MSERRRQVDALWRQRPRNRFVHASVWLLLGFSLLSLWGVDLELAEALSPRRLQNLARFLQEILPFPLQGREWDWTVLGEWIAELWAARGLEATQSTLAISILAIVLAGALGGLLALPAARTFTAPEPYAPSGRQPGRCYRLALRGLVSGTRLLLTLMRSLPEYVLAFLLLGMLGPSAWPAVLALCLHNAGILGRLDAEAVENLPAAPLRALRVLGASRAQLANVGLFPLLMPRFLLFFFYRWETCVREATVLGMLGILSLGYWIADARVRGQNDTFLFYVLLGAGIVLVGDLLSAWARMWVRRAA